LERHLDKYLDHDVTLTKSGELNQLSPPMVYYLRKVLRQNLDRLVPIASIAAAIDNALDPVSDLNATLENLYPIAATRHRTLHKIERLALYHQTLSARGSQHTQQRQETAVKLFALLGYEPIETPAIGTILIVDDIPGDVSQLYAALGSQTYRVLTANTGEQAMTIAQQLHPDLILLDAMVAGMNGDRIARQIKADPATADISIIFTSALNDAQSKVAAFAAGGADFIAKPFQIEEVLVRVKHQMQLRDLQSRLEEQNVRLQHQIQENQQLEGRYQSIIESSIDGIFQSAIDGHYLSVNPALAQIYGYDSPADLIATLTDIGTQLYVHPTRRDGLSVYLQQTGQIVGAESRVYRKDGRKIWISENVRAVKDSKDQILYYEGTVRDVTDRRRMESALRHQRQETDRLLGSLLPPTIVDRLRDRRETIADRVEDATVVVADIDGFTALCRTLSPTEVINLVGRLFARFDQLVEKLDLEKIKTVRDVYIAGGGVHVSKPDRAVACAQLALEMQVATQQLQAELGYAFALRIGISSGSGIAGVIGLKKITYDLWGDAVNLASRMQAIALPGQIQVSPETYSQLVDTYAFKANGVTDVLGIGKISTYGLLGAKPNQT
jgi:adenylate cyclase